MRRALALVILLSLCGGCRNRPAALDPFLGRTKVAPPGTGAVAAQPPGSLTYPAAPPPPSSPGLGTAPSNSSIYAPPGGFSPNTSGAPSNPFTTNPTQPGAGTPSVPARFTGTSGAAPLTGGTSSGGGPVSSGGTGGQAIRIVEPAPGATSTPASRAGTFTGAATGGVDIMDLPISGKTSQPQTAEGAGRGTQQSFLQPAAPGGTPISSGIDPSTARNSTLPGQEPVYGFNAQYSQLNGRLEYSAADGRWMLRYVEPGMRPDTLGGVVLLAPTTPSAELRSGAFVSAYGRVESSGGTSLPSFTATNVVPQRR